MAQTHRNDSRFFQMSLESVGMPKSDWTPNFRYVIAHYRSINI